MTERLREAVLWIGAALGALCLVWTVVMFAFGLTPLVFTSGSMEPAIGAGDLAFATTVDAKDLAAGDIVSVINDRGTRITHRVTKVDRQDNGDAILQLKGDANESPDQQAYHVSEVERVAFSVPKLGYVINVVGSPNGMFVGGLLVAGLLYLGFRRRDDGQPSSSPSGGSEESSSPAASREQGPVSRASLAVATMLMFGVVASTVGGPDSTAAAFGDSPDLVTGAFGAAPLPTRPASISCTEQFFSNNAIVTWADEPRLAYYYEVDDDPEFGSPGVRGTVTPSGTNSFTFNSSSVGGWGGWFSSTTYHIRVYSALVDAAGNQTWRSASYRSYRVGRTAFFNDFTCGAVTSP